MRRIIDLAIIAALAMLVGMVWLGLQRPADRYLEAVMARGVLRVGIDPTYPPFDMLSDGKVAGYDAALAMAIADDLGVRLEFQTLALDTLYDALETGKVDILLSALPVIPERQDKVRYSTPYYQAGQLLLVRAGDTRTGSLLGLEGKVLGVERGSAADTEARRIARDVAHGVDVRSVYQSAEEALSALERGELDAALADGVSVHAYLGTHPSALAIVPPPITDEPYVAAVPADAPALSASVNATISRLRASGELDRMMGGR